MKLKIDKFVIAIIATIIFAYIFPSWGSYESKVPLDQIGSLGISLIFFFYGLKLSPSNLKTGLKNWKLHLLIQSATFILFPVIVLLFYPTIARENSQTIWLSFFFLAALPSTVSSSVVMVSMAKGNIPAAIFNASISGLIGIAITPLWMGVFLTQKSTGFNLGDIYIKLLTEILIPIILGLIMQKKWGDFVARNQRFLSTFDKAIILLIIYKSFAESFEDNVFSSVNINDFLLISFAGTMLFYSVFHLIGYISKKLHFSPEDQITAQYCGTKKSLVHGTVFSKILFPAEFPVGIVLLPLMLFHALQIFIISILASKMAKKSAIIVFSILMVGTSEVLCQSNVKSEDNTAGIFQSYSDFTDNRFTDGFSSNRKGYSLWPKGFFKHKNLEFQTPEFTKTYKKNDVWGYLDHRGYLIRVFENRHYKVLDDKVIVIYLIYSPTRVSYHFSKSLNDPIYKLTRGNLNQEFSSNPVFLRKLESIKKKDLLSWNDAESLFLLNELFLE